MNRVFISHHNSDPIDTLIRLVRDLRFDAWSDHRMIPGEHFERRIRDEIRQAFCMVVILSESAIQSDWVRQETEWAEEAGLGLVPLVRGKLPPKADLPEWVRRLYNSRHMVRYADRIGSSVQRQVAAGIRWVESQPRSGQVVSFVNFKGGVGKTTLSALLGLLSAESKPTLLVDLDPQANLTELFLQSEALPIYEGRDRTVLSIFEPIRISKRQLEDVDYVPVGELEVDVSDELVSGLPVPLRPGAERRLHLLPGDFRMVKFGRVGPGPSAQYRASFAQVLNSLKQQYKLTILDCGPSASLLSECALAYADLVVAPVQPSVAAVRGLKQMSRAARDVFNCEIDDKVHPLFNMHDPNNRGEQRFIHGFRDDTKQAYLELGDIGVRAFRQAIPHSPRVLRLEEMLGSRRVDLAMTNTEIIEKLGVVGEPLQAVALELAQRL